MSRSLVVLLAVWFGCIGVWADYVSHPTPTPSFIDPGDTFCYERRSAFFLDRRMRRQAYCPKQGPNACVKRVFSKCFAYQPCKPVGQNPEFVLHSCMAKSFRDLDHNCYDARNVIVHCRAYTKRQAPRLVDRSP